MATIREIAELAGVSRGTVDRVLNHRGSVNAATAALVNDIAKKLDYKPNRAGIAPVSYTHLDVYKRQAFELCVRCIIPKRFDINLNGLSACRCV